MLGKVRRFIGENHMLGNGDRVLVCVSGGADSMCLLDVLMSVKEIYGLRLYVVHINHQLRGNDSDMEERYVADYCKENGIECAIRRVDVDKAMRTGSCSLEEAGRNLRYEAFYEVADDYGCSRIAVAHNQDDMAETVLFNMFRGAGIRGMMGIPLVRDRIIRPLLCVTREEVENYLSEKGILWHNDASNLSDDYTRNKIRHNVMAYAKSEVNAKAPSHICSLSAQLGRVYDYVATQAEKAYDDAVTDDMMISIEKTMPLHTVIREEVVMRVLEICCGSRKDITSKHVESVISLYHRQSGRQVHLPHGCVARREIDFIIICKSNESSFTKSNEGIHTKSNRDIIKEDIIICDKITKYPFPVIIGTYNLPVTASCRLGKQIKISLINYGKSDIIPKNDCTHWFDYDKIESNVILRKKKEFDYIQINRDGSSKSLKSFLINSKIPKRVRDEMLFLAAGSHILWIPGIRASEGFHVDDGTRRVLVAEVVG